MWRGIIALPRLLFDLLCSLNVIYENKNVSFLHVSLCGVLTLTKVTGQTATRCNACKKIISSKGGNSNMQKHLSTQHAITLQECHVFDVLQSDAGMWLLLRIDKRIDKESDR